MNEILLGERETFDTLAFSVDGTTMVTGSWDGWKGKLKLWDIASGKEHVSIEACQERLCSVAISADGRILASGAMDYTVKLWDAASGKELAKLKAHRGRVTCMAFSSDGKLLASGSYDSCVGLWDVASGQRLHMLQGHQGMVQQVAFSADGLNLASGGGRSGLKGELLLWNIASRGAVSFKGHGSAVYAVAFPPGGKVVASGSFDKAIRLWDVDSQKELAVLLGHRECVKSLAFSADGRTLASASCLDSTIKLWDLDINKEIATFKAQDTMLNNVVFSNDLKMVACSDGGIIKLLPIQGIYTQSRPEPEKPKEKEAAITKHEYAIVCRENSGWNASGINIPAFSDWFSDLGEAVNRVHAFCRGRGLEIRELPEEVGKGDSAFNDGMGTHHYIAKAWHCEPSERIHICEVGRTPVKGHWAD